MKILAWSRGVHRYGILTGRTHLAVPQDGGDRRAACGAGVRLIPPGVTPKGSSVACRDCLKIWSRMKRETQTGETNEQQ